MSDSKNTHNELDPRLQRMLVAYDHIPERDPQAARRTQARFIAELDTVFMEALPTKPATGSWVASTFNAIHENLVRLFAKRSIVFMGLALLLFLAYFLGGAGITAAARSALPGDPLYSLKTTIELVHADLTTDSAEQARLYMSFAGRRLIEIQSLVRKGRHNNIPRAAMELEMDVQRSLSAIQILSQTNPAQAANLTTEFSPVLQSYSTVLTHLLNVIPGSVRPALQHAIDICNIAAGHPDDDSTSRPTATPTPMATPVVVSPTSVLDVLTPVTIPGRAGNEDNNNSGNNSSGNGAGDGGSSQEDDDGDDDDGGGDG